MFKQRIENINRTKKTLFAKKELGKGNSNLEWEKILLKQETKIFSTHSQFFYLERKRSHTKKNMKRRKWTKQPNGFEFKNDKSRGTCSLRF